MSYFRVAVCVLLLKSFAFVGLVQAEDITLGFPAFSKNLNIVHSDHPLARFVSQAVSRGLIQRIEPGQSERFRLDVSDSFRVSADYREWMFRLPQGLRFSNGMEVGPSDVQGSLQECKTQGELRGVEELSLAKEARSLGGREEAWIALRLSPAAATEGTKRENFLADLEHCRIFQERLRRIFGDDFGYGTNIVSLGRYRIIGFNRGKEYRLQRRALRGGERTGVEKLALRGFQDARHGLTALRLGTIDAFFTKDKAVLERAKDDETLKIASCLSYFLISRGSLVYRCEPALEVTSFQYIS